MSTASFRAHSGLRAQAGTRNAIVGAGLIAVTVATVLTLPQSTPLHAAAAVGVTAIALWMVVTTRYEVTLAVVMLYLGLLDGFLKLKTGASIATLGRDVLLYAIAIGAIIRWTVRREAVRLPPLSGWVIAWSAVVLVQVFNPANESMTHSLAAVRPHLEWIPLFFLGYAAMRSKRRLRGFLLLLLLIAAANGVVGLIQFNLTPDQLADWGPGYERRITGEGDTAPRGFADEGGTLRTRPFALGSDMGFGGIVGLLAVPAALALLAARGFAMRLAVAALSSGVVIAIVTSQARVAIVGSIVAVFSFAAFSVASRAALRTIVAMSICAVVAYVGVSAVMTGAEQGAFDRYSDIAPGDAPSTAYAYRKDTLALIPRYATDFPLGAGIGSKGPAGGFAEADAPDASPGGPGLNAESQPTFLLIELGLPGLLVMLFFQLKLMGLSFRRIRKLDDPELRVLLAGVTAPVLALFVTWIVGVSTATTPGAPYVWFAAGTLAYWLGQDNREGAPERPTAPAQLVQRGRAAQPVGVS